MITTEKALRKPFERRRARFWIDQSRWFDPSVGKWLSEDPAAADPNLYRYCGNAPTDGVDPTGEQAESLVAEAIQQAFEWSHNIHNTDVISRVVEAAALRQVKLLVNGDFLVGTKRLESRFVPSAHRCVDVYRNTIRIPEEDSPRALAQGLGFDAKVLDADLEDLTQRTKDGKLTIKLGGNDVQVTIVSSIRQMGELRYTAVVNRGVVEYFQWSYHYYLTFTVRVPGYPDQLVKKEEGATCGRDGEFPK